MLSGPKLGPERTRVSWEGAFLRNPCRVRSKGSVHDLEVAVTDFVRPSKPPTSFNAEMNGWPELRLDFTHFLLRAAFVALTAGLFVVWLVSAS